MLCSETTVSGYTRQQPQQDDEILVTVSLEYMSIVLRLAMALPASFNYFQSCRCI